jgi:M6 family metalloprotease-like protein
LKVALVYDKLHIAGFLQVFGMRKPIRVLLVLIGLCVSIPVTYGVSAYPNPVIITQPDGSKITVTLKGDEHMKWAQTADGYSVMRNSTGVFEYSRLDANQNMIPSGVQARNEQERSYTDIQFLSTTPKGLTYSAGQVGMMKNISRINQKSTFKSAQISGTKKFLCILIGFTDKAFTKTKADYENLLNQPGYATDGAMGSVYDYYKENSYSQLNLSFTVAGPYVASHNMSYYGANNSQGIDVNPEALVTEAVKLADPTIDFTEFDNNKNGTVEGVYVVYAGYGEDAGASSSTIWAHTASIPPITLDGVTVSDYACSSELRGTNGTGISRIGPICHELGHILGAMDFYDSNYNTNGLYDGTGNWDIMANGAWNNNGVTPAHHNPYTKIFVYGWAVTQTFTSGANITLLDAEQNNNSFYIVNTATSNEFFLFENRQKQKFDSYIPGHGMIIYHVDGNYISTAGDQINIGSHQGLYPVCANATGLPPATYGVINGAGLPFPGTGNRTSFTDFTTPNALSWSSAKTNAPITNITEDITNKTVSFIAPVIPDRPLAPAANLASNIYQTTVIANWDLSSTATSYHLDVSSNPAFTTFLTGYNDKDVGNVKTYNVSGLNARTIYYYRIRAINLGGISDNSNIITLKTLSNPPATPLNLTSVSCNNLVTLKWRKSNDPYFLRYRIYGGVTNNPSIIMDSTITSNSDTTKILSGLLHGQNYYFRVTAVNDDGPESAFSSLTSSLVKTGVIPIISLKGGDVLICSNLGDSIKSYQWFRNNLLIPQATGQFYTSNKLPGSYTVLTTDLEGCKNTSNAITDIGLKSINLYPNPASDNFTLQLNDPTEGEVLVRIINSSGTKVMEFQVEKSGSELFREISGIKLNEGIYVVNVMINNKIGYSKKLIIKK